MRRVRVFLVLVIVSIGLGVILMPVLRASREKEAYVHCRSNLKNVGTAVEMYSTDHSGRFPPALHALLGRYMANLPLCPSAGRDTYSAGYVAASNPDAYTVVCASGAHGPVSMSNYPQYMSTQGLLEDGGSAYNAPNPYPPPNFNTQSYAHVPEGGFRPVTLNPLSTFGADVDTASYSNIRRFLKEGTRPPIDAVRIEEMLNYFPYSDPAPSGNTPFAVATEMTACPWAPAHRLLRIGLQARRVAMEDAPACNLVFLVDVSGSMDEPDKLPLVQAGLRDLVTRMRDRDRMAIVVYAGSTGLVLPSTPGSRRADILEALERLRAGGSTNGAAGIELAYKTASDHYIPDGINRVILATDGDFNVGVTDEGSLTRLIERERASGIFLTVLGVGRDNLKDAMMEKLADNGNGTYAYLDSLAEARKVLVREAGATLMTVAKDVKIQVEFNPRRVSSYRLIGYEDRALRSEEFRDDRKDAGDMGAGHHVTALYETVPAGTEAATSEALRYQANRPVESPEMLFVKVRYKLPSAAVSTEMTLPVTDSGTASKDASADMRLAAGVATFGLVLRGSEQRGEASIALARSLVESALGDDVGGERRELLDLLGRSETLVQRDP